MYTILNKFYMESLPNDVWFIVLSFCWGIGMIPRLPLQLLRVSKTCAGLCTIMETVIHKQWFSEEKRTIRDIMTPLQYKKFCDDREVASFLSNTSMHLSMKLAYIIHKSLKPKQPPPLSFYKSFDTISNIYLEEFKYTRISCSFSYILIYYASEGKYILYGSGHYGNLLEGGGSKIRYKEKYVYYRSKPYESKSLGRCYPDDVVIKDGVVVYGYEGSPLLSTFQLNPSDTVVIQCNYDQKELLYYLNNKTKWRAIQVLEHKNMIDYIQTVAGEIDSVL
jgi:hypothetical protein